MTILTLKNCWNDFNLPAYRKKQILSHKTLKVGQKRMDRKMRKLSQWTSDLESYYIVNFFYMSLDQVIGQLMCRFQGRDNNFICDLWKSALVKISKLSNLKTFQNFTTWIRSLPHVTTDSGNIFLTLWAQRAAGSDTGRCRGRMPLPCTHVDRACKK